jgi:hypothetical protein
MGVVTTLIVTTAASAYAAQWSQFRFDAGQSGINGEETTIGLSNANRWQQAWNHPPTAEQTFTTAPIVTEDTVYVGGSRINVDGLPKARVWAYDLVDGDELWVLHLPCESVQGPGMALGAGSIVATLDGCGGNADRVALIDALTGAKRKVLNFQHPLGSPTTVGGTAYLPNLGTSRTEVVDIASMSLVDQIFYQETPYVASGSSQPLPVVDGEVWVNAVSVPPALSGDGLAIVFVEALGVPIDHGTPTHGGRCSEDDDLLMCAVDVSTGDVLWSKELVINGGFNINQGLLAGDAFYSIGSDGVLHAYDLHTGATIWDGQSAPITMWPSYASPNWRPIYANGVVYVTGYDAVRAMDIVIGFDAATGAIVTTRPGTTRLGPPGGTYMAIANGRLVTTVPTVRVVTFDR